jgi:predicted membrane GTPase involved in stress response
MPDGKGRVRLDYMIPARGLIGFQTEFRTLTPAPACCSTCSTTTARETGAIAKRHERRGMVYEGMIVGIHSRDNDLVVNATKAKQLTNMRACRQRRKHPPDPADALDARAGAGIHRGRRAGRSHAADHSYPQT